MSRVNVEDEFFADPRFRALVRTVGDEAKALGLCVQAWFLGQKYWVDGKKLVPNSVWEIAGLVDLIKVDLAFLQDGHVYCRGAEKHFGWLLDLHAARSSAGRRSVEARREKYGSAQPSRPEQTEQTPNSVRTNSNSHRTNSNAPAPALAPSPALKDSPNGERGRSGPRAPYQAFLDLWQANRGTLAGVEVLSETRKAKVRARWAEKPDLGYWASCVQKMAGSSFCCEGSWASFDWLVKNDTNHVKVAEGKYDNRDGGTDDPDAYKKFFTDEERARFGIT